MGQRWTLTMVDRQCKGSSLGPSGPQSYPLTIPRHSLMLYTFLLASPNSHFSPSNIRLLTQSTFSSVSQPVGSQHTRHYTSLSLIHISEPTRLLSISYAVFCLKKK